MKNIEFSDLAISVKKLLDLETGYKKHIRNLHDVNKLNIFGMDVLVPLKEYEQNLIEPYVDISVAKKQNKNWGSQFKIHFIGNNSVSSANSNKEKKVFVDLVSKEEVNTFIKEAKKLKIKVVISEKVKKQLQ